MDNQNKNLILATALSLVVIIVWSLFFASPPPTQTPTDATTTAATDTTVTTAPAVPDAGTPVGETDTTASAEDLSAAPRVPIATDNFAGSISLLGGRIDDLSLTRYRETIEPDSAKVQLLQPVGQADAYFALFGWTATDGVAADAVPGPDTLWSLESGDTLTPTTPVTLAWNNGAGLTFRTEISVDDKFMFSFAQSVENATGTPVALRPYGLIRRHGEPSNLRKFFILHEGLVRMSDGTLDETKYKAIAKYDLDPREGTPAARVDVSTSGWIGYTDHYWMTTLIPTQGAPFRCRNTIPRVTFIRPRR